MTEIVGDLLDQKGILCHQVNCCRVAGAGLALRIRKRWPRWGETFRRARGWLGAVRYCDVGSDVIIADCYALLGYGNNTRRTRYDALKQCLQDVQEYAARKGKQVYIPYGMGCGLGGGKWPVVLQLIEDECPSAIIVRRPEEQTA